MQPLPQLDASPGSRNGRIPARRETIACALGPVEFAKCERLALTFERTKRNHSSARALRRAVSTNAAWTAAVHNAYLEDVRQRVSVLLDDLTQP